MVLSIVIMASVTVFYTAEFIRDMIRMKQEYKRIKNGD